MPPDGSGLGEGSGNWAVIAARIGSRCGDRLSIVLTVHALAGPLKRRMSSWGPPPPEQCWGGGLPILYNHRAVRSTHGQDEGAGSGTGVSADQKSERTLGVGGLPSYVRPVANFVGATTFDSSTQGLVTSKNACPL